MLRLALVGTGDAGKHHAHALGRLAKEKLISFTAIAARDAARVDAFRKEQDVAPEVTTFASYEALLDARVCDAVILATPDGMHAAQIEQAIARGLHVLAEKPFVATLAEGSRVVERARASGVHVAAGYHLRHHAAHRVAVERVSALVGTVRNVTVRWAWPDPAKDGWRARGDGARFWSLAALGTHGIDLALLFTGGHPPTKVACVREPASGIDRAAEVVMRFESGAVAHVSSAVTHRAISRVAVTGDLGEIELLGTLGARGDGSLAFRGPRDTTTTPIAF
ncbi:MAG: Gfo/Idh/MocA family oxidoreductase, partial [Polyangiaceae bacterium]